MTDQEITQIFRGADDFIRRELHCTGFTIYAYDIDGLVSGGDISQYILKPITELLEAESMERLCDLALHGIGYNAVAESCTDLDDVALKLVNGFCVVLFPGAGALAFEVKTGDKRGPSAPEVENTVKGAKDAFVETVRCDGTYLFFAELINKVVGYMLSGYIPQGYQHCFIENVPMEITYYVGNAVLSEEHGDFGTEDKPWMNSRFTAFLPYRVEVKPQKRTLIM